MVYKRKREEVCCSQGCGRDSLAVCLICFGLQQMGLLRPTGKYMQPPTPTGFTHIYTQTLTHAYDDCRVYNNDVQNIHC